MVLNRNSGSRRENIAYIIYIRRIWMIRKSAMLVGPVSGWTCMEDFEKILPLGLATGRRWA